MTAITSAPSDTAAKTAALKVVNTWINETPKESVLLTTGINDEENKQKFVAEFVRGVNTPWFRYFFQYDPAPAVRKINAKVLALNGDKDIQVIASSNLSGLKAASSSKTFDVVELKGLNHLFQRCQKCTVNEYAELEETIAPEALEVIGNWLAKKVK